MAVGLTLTTYALVVHFVFQSAHSGDGHAGGAALDVRRASHLVRDAMWFDMHTNKDLR